MRKIVSLLCAGALLGGCTLTSSTGQPVVLTTANAQAVILDEMRKGCPALVAAGQAAVAIAQATQAAQSVQGNINNVSNMASIACSLLVPPPAAVAPAG